MGNVKETPREFTPIPISFGREFFPFQQGQWVVNGESDDCASLPFDLLGVGTVAVELPKAGITDLARNRWHRYWRYDASGLCLDGKYPSGRLSFYHRFLVAIKVGRMHEILDSLYCEASLAGKTFFAQTNLKSYRGNKTIFLDLWTLKGETSPQSPFSMYLPFTTSEAGILYPIDVSFYKQLKI